MIISRSVLLRTRSDSEKGCRENKKKIRIQYNFSENCAIYEIRLKNMLEPDRTQMTTE